MPCPDFDDLKFYVDALGRVVVELPINDYNVGDTLEVLDAWIKERNDTPVPTQDARPGWLSGYEVVPPGGEQYTGDYVLPDQTTENGTIQRGLITWDFLVSDASFAAELGNTLLIGLEITDNVGDPVEHEFCWTYKQLGAAVALAMWEDDITGGVLLGGYNSLGNDLVVNTYTNYQKSALGWDPVTALIYYSNGNFNSSNFDIYRSPIDNSGAATLVRASSERIYGFATIGRTLYWVSETELHQYDLDADSYIGGTALPSTGQQPPMCLAVDDQGTLHFIDRLQDLYTFNGSFTLVGNAGTNLRCIAFDGGTLYGANLDTDKLCTVSTSDGSVTDTTIPVDSVSIVVNGKAYVGVGSPPNDVSRYDVATEALEEANQYFGGSTGTVSALVPISEDPTA